MNAAGGAAVRDPSTTPGALGDKVVLVVEDSALQRAHLVDLMQALAFGTVLQAEDGFEALNAIEAAGRESIYLVVTDIDMPRMDGIELIGRLAERGRVEHLIVMSARDPRLLETVESLAADNARLQLLGTLTKPVTQASLTRLLSTAEGRKRVAAVHADQAAPGTDELGAAIEAGQFEPFVQPKIAIRTGVLKGVEALARWRHPERGLVYPGSFIPQIEGTALMAQLTLSMVEQSLRWLREWLRAMPALTLSLNLSADDLADQDFVDRLVALVQRHEIAPSSLIWEVTETMLMGSSSLANLARLGLRGFGLAMDDYGIGYSSMQTLSRSPFTELKIDRIFVDGASERVNRRAMLDSSLDLGRRLGISTVAEGVETVADWDLLRELGCDIAQGYLLARPMPPGELLGWTRTNRQRLRGLAQRSPGADASR
ncbi:MAG: EAL domain-containing protein [Vitreoscilla sp.]